MDYEKNRKGLIAKIHIAKQQLNMDDDTYRAILQRTTGQNSTKNCDLAQLQRVMTEMERLGFQPTSKSVGRKPLHLTDVSELMNKIAVLLKNLDKSWAYANGIAKRMFQKDNVNQLNHTQLRKVLVALNYQYLKMQAEQAKKA